MNEFATVQLISLIAWLILAATAVASFRLDWKESVRLSLMWAGIFLGVFLVFTLVIG